MQYFQNFPRIYYGFDLGEGLTLLTVKDIALNVRVQKDFLDLITIYDLYDIEDGETPDIISSKIYGKPTYHWLIMLVNQRFDYIKDWPMSEYELVRYCQSKYGEDHVYDQHQIFGQPHYKDMNGNVVSPLSEDMFRETYPWEGYGDYLSNSLDEPKLSFADYRTVYKHDNYAAYMTQFETVENITHERYLNDEKRRIKLLSKDSADSAISEIARLLKG